MKRIPKRLFIIGLATLVLGTVTVVQAARGKWDIRRIKGNTIYFRNGEQIATKLHDIQYVGKLQFNGQSPLYILSGADCQDCDKNLVIFLFTPAEKEKVIKPELAPYDFPGREFSAEDSTLLYQSRMFFGQVLPDVPNGIIWYQEMLTEDGVMQKSAYLIKINGDKIQEEFLLQNLPDMDVTLKLAAANRCQELKGVDTVSEL